jgi:hypothetical protein
MDKDHLLVKTYLYVSIGRKMNNIKFYTEISTNCMLMSKQKYHAAWNTQRLGNGRKLSSLTQQGDSIKFLQFV